MQAFAQTRPRLFQARRQRAPSDAVSNEKRRNLSRAFECPNTRHWPVILRDTAKWFGAEPSLNALRPHTGHLPASYLIDDPAAQERQRRSWRYAFRHSQSLRLSIITRSDTQTMSSCWKPIAVKRCGVAGPITTMSPVPTTTSFPSTTIAA